MSAYPEMKKSRLIDYLESPSGNSPSATETQIDTQDVASPKTVVFLHGYGANAYDLFSLAEAYQLPGVSRWYFPDGLLSAPGVPGGKAWFPIDMDALERAMMTGQPRDFSKSLPQELISSREAIMGFLQEMNLDPKNVVLGGFSQGAMLALDVTLNMPTAFAGLILFSGTKLGTDEWPFLMNQKSGAHSPENPTLTPVFQSHGEQDPVLPFDNAKTLFADLQRSGWQGQFFPFQGGHEIPLEVLQLTRKRISSWLKI